MYGSSSALARLTPTPALPIRLLYDPPFGLRAIRGHVIVAKAEGALMRTLLRAWIRALPPVVANAHFIASRVMRVVSLSVLTALVYTLRLRWTAMSLGRS